MGSTSNRDEKLFAVNALQPGADEARAQPIQTTLGVGQIPNAGAHAAQIWLPHFDNEDRTIFPVPQASDREKDGAVAELANNPRIHEIIEDEVVCPATVSIGK